MGDPRNITEKTFEQAAKAWGQSVLEAKRNTLSLLEEDLRRHEAKNTANGRPQDSRQ